MNINEIIEKAKNQPEMKSIEKDLKGQLVLPGSSSYGGLSCCPSGPGPIIITNG